MEVEGLEGRVECLEIRNYFKKKCDNRKDGDDDDYRIELDMLRFFREIRLKLCSLYMEKRCYGNLNDGIFIRGNVLKMHPPTATAFDKASIRKDLEDFKSILDDVLETTLLVDVWRRHGFEDFSKQLGKVLRVFKRRSGECCEDFAAEILWTLDTALLNSTGDNLELIEKLYTLLFRASIISRSDLAETTWGVRGKKRMSKALHKWSFNAGKNFGPFKRLVEIIFQNQMNVQNGRKSNLNGGEESNHKPLDIIFFLRNAVENHPFDEGFMGRCDLYHSFERYICTLPYEGGACFFCVVEEIRDAFKHHIQNLAWMSREEKNTLLDYLHSSLKSMDDMEVGEMITRLMAI